MLLINLIVYPIFITLCLLASKYPKAMYSAAPIIGFWKYAEIFIQLYYATSAEKLMMDMPFRLCQFLLIEIWVTFFLQIDFIIHQVVSKLVNGCFLAAYYYYWFSQPDKADSRDEDALNASMLFVLMISVPIAHYFCQLYEVKLFVENYNLKREL